MALSLYKIAKSIFDGIIVLILLTLSVISIVGLIPMIIGVVGYMLEKPEERGIKTIFTSIKFGGKTLILFTIVETVLLVASILNIAVLSLPDGWFSQIILFISWVLLVLAMWWLIFAPVIIIKMNVTLHQLLANCAIIFVKGSLYSWLLIAIGALGMYISLTYPYASAIVISLLSYAIVVFTNPTIERLKKKGDSNNEKSLQSINHSL